MSSAVTALGLGLAALVAGLVWTSLGWPLLWDAPLMHYVAWRILEGAVPYRDLFDMNFPGVYLLHMAVLLSVGPSSAAWRAVDLGLSAAIALLLYRIARPFGARAAALAALFFSAYHLTGGPQQEGQRDLFLFGFLLAATLAGARALEREERRALHAFSAGLWVGIGVSIKPVALLYGAVLAGALVLAVRRGGRWLRPLASFSAGAALPLVGVAAWLVWTGALRSFLEIVFSFVLPLYPRIGRQSVWHTLSGVHYAYLALLTALALGSAALGWGRRELRPRAALLLAGLAYGILNYVAQGKGWSYHLIPWVGFAWPLAVSRLEAAPARGGIALLAGLGALFVATAAKGVQVSREVRALQARPSVVEQLAAELRPCTARGATVQVMDTTSGGIHALLTLRVRQPTRFIYDFQFFFEPQQSYVRDLRTEFMRDLKSDPPGCVVVFRDAWPEGDYGRLATFPELRDWLASGYAITAERDGYRVYAQRGDQANHPGL